jgi:HEAT repeat protein
MIKGILEKLFAKNILKPVVGYEPKMLKEHSEEILRLINEEKDLTAVPDAFWLLLGSDNDLELKSAKSLHAIISSLNTSNLTVVDRLFRERTSFEWSYDWHNEEPINLTLPSMPLEERTTILGLSSFHPNGYFREKAVKALSGNITGQELPYLLIRLNDWVPIVRNAAKSAIIKNIRAENARNIIDNLPLILRLKNCERDQHKDIINRVFEILSNDTSHGELIYGLKSKDSKVRLHCFDIIIDLKLLDNKQLISYLLKEKVPYIRMAILNKINEVITLDEFKPFILKLLNDKYVPIRLTALEMLYKYDADRCIEELVKLLTDKSSSVRERARFLLKNHGYDDFASYYIDSIHKHNNTYGAICGLGEVGKAEDTKYLMQFLESDKVNIIKATIKALSRLDFLGFKELIINYIEHSHIGVSKDTRKILDKQVDLADAEKVYNIFKNSKVEHVRANAALLLCSLSKWESINYIIEMCGNQNQDISKFGQLKLEGWVFNFNRSYLPPSKEQQAKLRSSIKKYEQVISEDNRKFIEFCIRDF